MEIIAVNGWIIGMSIKDDYFLPLCNYLVKSFYVILGSMIIIGNNKVKVSLKYFSFISLKRINLSEGSVNSFTCDVARSRVFH